MIIPSEFIDCWDSAEDGPLLRFGADLFKNINIDDTAKAFLMEAGLPESAAPFLDFLVPNEERLPTVSQIWGLPEQYNIYHCIGSNGSGDPVCIKEPNGHIVYLNHDDDFREVLMNASVSQLAESLLAYARLIRETIEENGAKAFLDNHIPQRLQEWIAQELKNIDPLAVQAGCFWSNELNSL